MNLSGPETLSGSDGSWNLYPISPKMHIHFQVFFNFKFVSHRSERGQQSGCVCKVLSKESRKKVELEKSRKIEKKLEEKNNMGRKYKR